MQPLMQRIIATRAIKLKEGKLRIWGVPAAIYSLFTVSYMTRLLEKGYSGKDIFYWAGYYQSKAATHTMKDRFGYKKKIIENVCAHSYMLGLGGAKPKIIDVKRKRFIINSPSEPAKEYLRDFGINKEPVCHFFKGQCAGLINTLFEEEFLAIEEKCIAMGDKICQINVKPKKDWNLKDKNVKAQIPKKMPSPAELDCKLSKKYLPQR